jgi:succinate-semialdehyde dehydrogenase / glutarate-semialdehyde dehydrogenase
MQGLAVNSSTSAAAETSMKIQARLQDPSLLREQAFVGGVWISADDGGTLPVTDPATFAQIGTVPALGAVETRRAILAAEAAWPAWRALPSSERGRLLETWYDPMIEHLEDLALIMTVEQGKPLAEARGEIRYGAGFIKWFAEEARRIYGDTVPAPTADRRIILLKEPVGVCAAITPWNFPTAMITRKAGPALAAGCPIVIKPSELTPYSALALAVLAERAGIPKGVVSIVTGTPQGIGGELTSHDAVRKLSFTGLDTGWPHADAAMRRHREARQLRARRQRALHHLRRCGHRPCRFGIDGQQIPQRWTDLRLRQPHPGPGWHL